MQDGISFSGSWRNRQGVIHFRFQFSVEANTRAFEHSETKVCLGDYRSELVSKRWCIGGYDNAPTLEQCEQLLLSANSPPPFQHLRNQPWHLSILVYYGTCDSKKWFKKKKKQGWQKKKNSLRGWIKKQRWWLWGMFFYASCSCKDFHVLLRGLSNKQETHNGPEAGRDGRSLVEVYTTKTSEHNDHQSLFSATFSKHFKLLRTLLRALASAIPSAPVKLSQVCGIGGHAWSPLAHGSCFAKTPFFIPARNWRWVMNGQPLL